MSEKASRLTKIMRVVIIALFVSAITIDAIHTPKQVWPYLNGVVMGFLLFGSAWGWDLRGKK